jgi:hypothetical protein
VIHLDPLEVALTVIERPEISRISGGSGLTLNRACEHIATSLKCARIGDAFFTAARFRTPRNDFGKAVAKSVVFRISAVID